MTVSYSTEECNASDVSMKQYIAYGGSVAGYSSNGGGAYEWTADNPQSYERSSDGVMYLWIYGNTNVSTTSTSPPTTVRDVTGCFQAINYNM